MKTRSQQPCFHRSEWWNHVFISCLLLFCVSKWHLWALPPPSVRLKFLLAPPPAWWYLLTNTFHTGDGWEADERLDLWDRLSLIPSRWSSSWACEKEETPCVSEEGIRPSTPSDQRFMKTVWDHAYDESIRTCGISTSEIFIHSFHSVRFLL